MNVLQLLEVDTKLVTPEARQSLLLAERVWSEEGSPQEPRALSLVLEKILQRCMASGIWYAPVLLQRKKSLERGTWRPCRAPGKSDSTSAQALRAAAQGLNGLCPACGGTGIVVHRGGFSGSLCSCGAYLKDVQSR